jgi:UDP-N-acetyl-D-glucosamine dehydrogenase
MPYYVVDKVIEGLSKKAKPIANAKVLVLGLAYKKDIDDTRESPSLKLIELLSHRGALVDYNDPYVPRTRKMRKYVLKKDSVDLTRESLGSYDCVVIATDHTCYDYEMIVKNSALVVDARNAVNGLHRNGNVIKA